MSPRQVLINLVASLSLADHMGDAYEDCEKALRDVGIAVPPPDGGESPWSALAAFLAENHNAETVWGTTL